MDEETFPVHVFRDSFSSFITLLKEHQVQHRIIAQRTAMPMAASGVVELFLNASLWGSLAVVIVAYLKGKASRKVIITLKDNMIMHAEGLSAKEVERLLEKARSLVAIETEKDET